MLHKLVRRASTVFLLLVTVLFGAWLCFELLRNMAHDIHEAIGGIL